MNKTFFTADTHFNHANVIGFNNRPWDNVWDMNEGLILNWNNIVGKNDLVYVLGDFAFGNAYAKGRVVERLNGVIHLVPGGHDGGKKVERTVILDPIFVMEQGKNPPIVLCHYAMLQWPMKHYGAIHLFGHSHGRLPIRYNCLDVGVDTNNYEPYTIEAVYDKIAAQNQRLEFGPQCLEEPDAAV